MLRTCVLALFAFVASLASAAIFGADPGDGIGLGMLGMGTVALTNRGRMINSVSGITGIAPGGVATINLPCDRRYHRIVLNVTEAGAATDIADIISEIKLIVGGVSVRDIDPSNIVRIQQNNGYFPNLGELNLFFTEPFATTGLFNEPDDVTSWDMSGQSTFQIQIKVNAASTVPGVTGFYEFDFVRNEIPEGGVMVPFLQIVNQHQFTVPLNNGRTDILTLPFNYPIRRLYFLEETPGSITAVEIIADQNLVLEATSLVQLKQIARQYGFKFGDDDVLPFTATGLADLATKEALTYFSGGFYADIDARWWRALRVGRNLNVRVTSSAAQDLTIVQEMIPGAYAS